MYIYIYIYIYNLNNCTYLTDRLNIRGKDMPLVSFIKDAVLPVVERYNMRYRNQQLFLFMLSLFFYFDIVNNTKHHSYSVNQKGSNTLMQCNIVNSKQIQYLQIVFFRNFISSFFLWQHIQCNNLQCFRLNINLVTPTESRCTNCNGRISTLLL